MAGGVLFFVGLVGLILVSIFFLWELKNSTRVFADARAKCDRATSAAYRTLVFGEVPHVYRTSLIGKLRTIVHTLVHTLVLGLRAIERPLSRMSHSLTYSQKNVTKRGGDQVPSPFLKDIGGTKKDGKKPDNPV